MKRFAAALLVSIALALPAYGQTVADSAKAAIGTSGMGLYLFGGQTGLGYFDGTSPKPKSVPIAPLELGQNPSFFGTTSSAAFQATGSALVATSQYNTNGQAFTKMMATVGTTASPSTDPSAVAIFKKTSNYGSAGNNTTVYASHVKMSSAGSNEALAIFGEAIDMAGGAQSSVVGVSGHAQLSSGSYGSATGLAGSATVAAGVSSLDFVFGAELAIENVFQDAPATFNQASFMGALLLDADGSKMADAFAVTNPYSPAKARVGYLVAPNTTTDAAYRSFASTLYGIDLAGCGTNNGTRFCAAQSLGSVRIPNNTPIVARNAAGTADVEIERLDTANSMVLGAGATSIKTPVPIVATSDFTKGPTLDNRAAAPITVPQNGSVAIGGGSVGGFFFLCDVTTQFCGAYGGDAATSFVLLGGNSEFSASSTAPAAGHTSLAFDGSVIRIYNNTGSPQGYRMVSVPFR